MATYYLSSVNGDDATADGTKSLPYATLGAIPYTNGDVILVDSAHSSAENVLGPDASAGPPLTIVSIDWATDAYLRGAKFSKGAGIVMRGGLRTFGVSFYQTSSTYWLEFGKDVHTDIEAHDGVVGPGNGTSLILSGPSGTTFYANRVRLHHMDIALSAGTRVLARWGVDAELVGCIMTSDPGTDGVIELSEGHIFVDGLDTSTMTSGALINPSGNARAIIRNTPIPAGVSLLASTGLAGTYLAGADILYTSPSGSLDVFQQEGQASTTTAVYRTGGATVGGSPASLLCTTSARAVPAISSLAIPIDRQVLDLSAARTIRVYFAQDGGTALTDQDIWLEVRYRAPSDGRSRTVTTRPIPIVQAATTLPSDTASTWTGLTTVNAQYVDAAIPVDVAGDAHAEIIVHIAATSATVYVDPAAGVI